MASIETFDSIPIVGGIRSGSDGITFDNAGNAVRYQAGSLAPIMKDEPVFYADKVLAIGNGTTVESVYKIPASPNTTYFYGMSGCSGTLSSIVMFVIFFDSNNTELERHQHSSGIAGSSYAVTSPANTAYIRLSLVGALGLSAAQDVNAVFENVFINEGYYFNSMMRDDIVLTYPSLLNTINKIDNSVMRNLLDIDSLLVGKTIPDATHSNIGMSLNVQYSDAATLVASQLMHIYYGMTYTFFLKYSSSGFVLIWDKTSGRLIEKITMSVHRDHMVRVYDADMWLYAYTAQHDCVCAFVGGIVNYNEAMVISGNADLSDVLMIRDGYHTKLDPIYSTRNASEYMGGSTSDNFYQVVRGTLFENDINSYQPIAQLKRQSENTHDATLCVKDGIFYVVHTCDTGTGDAANSPTAIVRLDAVDGSGNLVLEKVVSQSGDVHGDYTVTGGSGSPNMVIVGDTAHIMYCSNVNNTYMIMHAAFDISSSAFTSYEPITIDGAIADNDTINELFGLNYASSSFTFAQMNATIGENNGTYYAGLCAGQSQAKKSVVLSTSNFVAWSVFKTIEFTDVTPIFELALCCKDGYLFAVQRPNYTQEYTYLYKINLSTSEIVDRLRIVHCSSRPEFFICSGSLYLVTNPHGRNNFSLIKVDTSNLANSKQPLFANVQMNYPSIKASSGSLYLVRSNNDMELRAIDIDQISDADIKSTIISVFR